ncbi:two-component system sensor histidine kinase NtrB [Paenibacillus psychroresistens]|nr:ATP-binding protein [Paenibacillus psychroresistens]
MYLVSKFNNDKMLIIGLLLHLIAGWIWFDSIQGKHFLIVATCVLLLNMITFVSLRSFWRKTIPFQRYIHLLSLVCCTLFIQATFLESLIPMLHMIVIIVVSAFYLVPRLIWFISMTYFLSYFIFIYKTNFPQNEIYVSVVSITFILFIVIALHKICLICHLQMTQIQKLERDHNFERMGQQQHLATIGQIAASIAHDIRNPLTSIQGFIQLIEKNEQKNEQSNSYHNYFQIIRSEITRIDTLLREVLMLSKSHTADSDSWSIIHLDGLLERLVLLMDPDALKSNIQIRLHLNHAPVVRGSEDKLQQVFMNLLRNAIEAISENGRIDIILKETDGLAIIHFQDTGSGIDETSQDHLFTPFFTTKGEGTGLGLSICQSIIKAYDGEIKVRNLPEKGAEFTVILPI